MKTEQDQAFYKRTLELIEVNIGIQKLHLKGATNERDKQYHIGQIHALQDFRYELINYSSPPVEQNSKD